MDEVKLASHKRPVAVHGGDGGGAATVEQREDFMSVRQRLRIFCSLGNSRFIRVYHELQFLMRWCGFGKLR